MQRIFLKKSRTKKDRLCWCEMTEFLYTKAYPKVNVALKICERKKKLHTISSRFVLAMGNLYDEILFFKTQTLSNINSHYHTSFIFEEYCAINPHYKICILGNFNCDLESNLIYKAYVILHKQSLHSSTLSSQKTDAIKSLSPHINTIQQQYIVIAVKKSIPIGGGLGGGSADAGCVLRALIAHYGSDFVDEGKALAEAFFALAESGVLDSRGTSLDSSRTKEMPSSPLPYNLAMLAKSIGADVAFFLSGAMCAEVRGVGEEVVPLELDSDDIRQFEVFTPPLFCDTKRVYSAYRAMVQNKSHSFSPRQMFASKSNQEILSDDVSVFMLNDLFAPACAVYPQLLEIQKELGNGWFFSGSGSSFFRPIKNIQAESRHQGS